MARQPGHAPTVGAGGGTGMWGSQVPGECITNALPIDDGMSTPWGPDLWHIWEGSAAGVACGASQRGRGGCSGATDGGGEEEDQRRRPSMSQQVVPLQAPEPV